MSSDKENVADERYPLTLSDRHHFIAFEGLDAKLKEAHEDKTIREALRNGFTDPPAELFLVRGPNYLSEGKGGKNLTHLKIPSKEPVYNLIGVNMFETSSKMNHVSQEVGELKRFFDQHDADGAESSFPQFLVINWLMSPLFGWGKSHCVQHVFRFQPQALREKDPALEAAFSRFLHGSDDVRSAQLKYMFRVVQAPSAVKGAISYMGGERPVLIGKALKTTYNRGKNYLEINSDVSSSKIASAINGTILKNVEKLVMDCSWLLEGQREEELPERLLCKIRWIWNSAEEVMIKLDSAGEREKR